MATTNGVSSGMAELCRDLKDRVDRFLAADHKGNATLQGTQKQVAAARDVIDEALRRYGPEELSLSYNGGKDCLVLLVLILASLGSGRSGAAFPASLQALYIRPALPFPEVDAFVASSSAHYRLDLTTSDRSMKEALTDYLAARPALRAVFVGTRRTDPHGASLTSFDETDKDWPRFMRIHPVIDWHYREVWAFIRALEIPYCSLYDKGYTSLGGTDDTHPNPALKKKTPAAVDGPRAAGRAAFRPAYELMEDEEERLGRDK